MKAAIVIPSRYGSSRFPGKPLTPIVGATGIAKSLIARCVEAARAVRGVDRIVVATDDERIAAEAAAAGAEATMTPASCRNGTERVAAAVRALGIDAGIVVNLQGDEPLMPPWFVEALIDAMRSDPMIDVATPVVPFAAEPLAKMRRDLARGRKGPTTAVFSPDGNALYFSKAVIPFVPEGAPVQPIHRHVGLYAYRPAALAAYAASDPTPLEEIETLEQLRFLELGGRIRAVLVDDRGNVAWEVNNPDDVPPVEAELSARGIA